MHSLPIHLLQYSYLLNGYSLVEAKSKHHADEAEGEHGELLGQLIHVLLQGCAWGLLLLHHLEELPELRLLPGADDYAPAPSRPHEGAHICDVAHAA